MTTDDRSCFYITTPIYYANAKPHLGHLYSTVLADVAARLQNIRGKETFLLTGTDEHGQKIAHAAAAQGLTPQALVDITVEEFRRLWAEYGITYTQFMRTTDAYHIAGVQAWIRKLMQQGDIYKGTYTGLYCVPCETFVTEKDFDASLSGIPCPSCGRPTIEVAEECYFFRLSAYQDRLLEWYRNHPNFITPKERMAEVVSFVTAGLKDLSISRTTVTWGIPFPDDERHTVYVWADALNNYITAVGYGDINRADELKKWWPADVQVMGKDIVRFHAVYWPAFLMAAGMELPHQLLVHGFFKVGEQKMSKSLGNAVDPFELARTYGADAIRFYLVRHMAITQDSPFSIPELEQRLNADLAHDLGNLVNRMLTLAQKHGLSQVRPPEHLHGAALELRDTLWTMLNDVNSDMEEYYFHRAYGHVWKFIGAVNAYFHAQEPWKVAKTDPEHFEAIISAVCHSLYAIAVLVWPVMPHKMGELLAALGAQLEQGDLIGQLAIEPWLKTFTLTPINPLFKQYERLEPTPIAPLESLQQKEDSSMITIDQFAAIELRIGTIEQCEEVPKSDKLYKLQVNFGEHGMRQIFSGVKQYIRPDELMQQQAIFVYNLAPRKMMGSESHGMLLTAQDSVGKLKFATISGKVPNGTLLK